MSDASDLAAFEAFRRKLAAGEEELIPAAVVDRILAGESRVRVWRDHRGLSVAALAGTAGLEIDRMGGIEAGTREATVDELRRIATALGVTLDDLAG